MKTSSILLLALLPLLTAGCSEGTPGGQTYTVRGRVDQLPAQGSGLTLTHEAIDDWKGRSGNVEGMDTMSMPFPVGEDVSLEGIQPGDVVEIQLYVDWEEDLAVRITAIRELPPDTRLDFREAKPKT